MRILTLLCNHCGAPLEVPGKTKFLTCTYCGTSLKVQESGGAAYTEAIESLENRTAQIQDDVQTLKLQNELERLDREWELERKGLVDRTKEGHESVPTMIGSVMMGLIFSCFGLFFAFSSASAGAPFFFPIVGVFFALFGVMSIFAGSAKAEKYQTRYRKYQQDRKRIWEQLQQHG